LEPSLPCAPPKIYRHRVEVGFSRPGKPGDNPFATRALAMSCLPSNVADQQSRGAGKLLDTLDLLRRVAIST